MHINIVHMHNNQNTSQTTENFANKFAESIKNTKEVSGIKKTILKNLEEKFHVEQYYKDNNFYVTIKKEHYLDTAKYLKEQGFKRLVTISAVDWLERGVLEVYFLAYSFDNNLYIKVATEVPRDNPSIPSLSSLWENAEMHEREAWEMFGINFEGNNMLKPLFLEDPPRIPPFRKDFDWREEVKKEYGLTWPEY